MILGFTVAITLGPALFALLQTSIKHGVKTGIFLALGIFASDLLIVVMAVFGVSGIITNPDYNLIFGIIGGIVMEFFGIFTFFRKLPESDQIQVHTEIKVKRPGSIPYFFKGFVLNIANPSLWFFWVTAVVSISATYNGPRKNELVAFFFFGALATIFTTDILKCFLAKQIKILEKPSVKRWVNRIVGILFVIIGIIIISGTIYTYYHHEPASFHTH